MPTASRVTSRSRSKTPLRIMLCSGLAIGAFCFLLAGIKVSAVSDVLAAWSFEGVTTTNTGTAPVVSVGSAAADSGVLTAGFSLDYTLVHPLFGVILPGMHRLNLFRLIIGRSAIITNSYSAQTATPQ